MRCQLAYSIASYTKEWNWISRIPRIYYQSQRHIATDGRSVSESWCRAPSGAHDQIFITVWQLQSCFYGASSLMRGRVCLLYMQLALASAVFLGAIFLGLVTIFYCLRFETSLFVASYDSQGHSGGIQPRFHTGKTTHWHWLPYFTHIYNIVSMFFPFPLLFHVDSLTL
jgi:hypothetical protein